MLADLRVIAVIPARGGSTSVPGKNIHPLGNKPLIVWSIDVARRVEAIDRIIVSTDDNAIADTAARHGAEVYPRPPHLASNGSPVADTVRDLFRRLLDENERPDVMVLLEPTCPLRSEKDVADCLDLIREGFDSAATFREAGLNPHRAWKIEGAEPRVFIPGAVPWLPRQLLPKAYQLNGAVYAFRPAGLAEGSDALLFGRMGAVIMPAERSVDIDTEIDFLVAEAVLQRSNG